MRFAQAYFLWVILVLLPALTLFLVWASRQKRRLISPSWLVEDIALLLIEMFVPERRPSAARTARAKVTVEEPEQILPA
jgi:hypothetical protein